MKNYIHVVLLEMLWYAEKNNKMQFYEHIYNKLKKTKYKLVKLYKAFFTEL